MSKPSQPNSHYIHRLSYSAQERLVGVFVILGLVVLFSLFAVNSRNLHLFEDYIQVTLFVDRAEGIGKDTPVRVSGIPVGRVDQVELTPENLVRIRLRVYESYTQMLRANSKPVITLSLLGRTTIDFNAGNPDLDPIKDGEVFYVESPFSIEELMTRAGPMLERIDQTITRVAEITQQIEPEQVAMLLSNANQLTQNLAQLTEQVTQSQGLANRLLTDEAFAEQVINIVSGLERTLALTEARIVTLGPILDDLGPVMSATREAAPLIPEVLAETAQTLTYVNETLKLMQPELTNMPDMLRRVNMLMNQSERLLQQVSGMWFMPQAPAQPSSDVELVPHG